MKITKSYKTELKLNNKERSLLNACAGTARFTYNWGLARKKEAYEKTGKSPNATQLHKELNQLKKGELAWMYSYSKCIPQQAFRDLDLAYQHFFRRVKEGADQAGFPKFKSRHTAKKSFYLEGSIVVAERAIRLPRVGWLRLKEKEYLPILEGRPISCRLSERGGRWFLALVVEEEAAELSATGEAIGIDLGINRLAALSDGTVIENPKHFKRSLKQLQRAQRALSRKQKGSRNRAKTRGKVAQLHLRISNQRRDTIHKGTSAVVAKAKPSHLRPQAIVLEDLHVKGMSRNPRLAQALHDASMGEMRRQLEYKCAWSGIELQLADRWFPSSKLCSGCGHKKEELTLSERTYRCERCQIEIDRDLNAALNLAQLYPI